MNDNLIHDLMARIEKLEARMHAGVMPSQQAEVTTEGATATAMMTHVAGAQSAAVPIHQNYGFWSRPLPGALHTVVNVGGTLGRAISISSSDERYRPLNLGQGDVMLRDNSAQFVWLAAGTTITLTANQTLVINAPSVNINASTKVTVTSPLVECSQNVHVKGNLSVDGTMNVTGTGGGGATATFQGTVTATTDVVAGTVHLAGHHHTGVTTGAGNTGGPV